MGRTTTLLLLSTAFVAPTAARQDTATVGDDVAALASAARDALGIGDAIASATLRGRAKQTGLEGDVVILLRDDGASRRDFTGPVTLSGGNDGDTSWEIDWGGIARTFDLGEDDGSIVNAALLTGAWARPNGPLVLRRAPENATQPALGFTRSTGFVDGVIELDPKTHMPREVRWTVGTTPTKLTFDRWSDGQRRWPMAITRTVRDKVSGFDIEHIETGGVLDDAAFALPGETAPARFDEAIETTIEVDRAPSGHLLVRPTVNGEDVGWFIFDTGAGENCIDASTAESLGLDAVGTIVAEGVGGRTDQSLRIADALTLGPMTVERPIFVDLDLAFLEGPFGRKIGGIIGYGLHARCVFEYEPSTPFLALHDPATYGLAESERWGELSLYQRHPVIRGSVDEIDGYYNVDSGAGGTCVFHSPFVDAHDLLNGKDTKSTRSGGVGGTVKVLEGSVDSLVLAGREFGPLDVGFARTDDGAFADPYLAGNLGAEIFGVMRTVFDYPSRRVAFTPIGGAETD